MRKIDDSLKILQTSLPGLVIKSYTTTDSSKFEMLLEMDGKEIRSEGYVLRLRRIDKAFIEQVRAAFL